MKYNVIRFVVAILLAGFVVEFIHTNVGIGGQFYGTFIDTIAYLTKPEEALGVAIVYYFRRSFSNKISFFKGDLLRFYLIVSQRAINTPTIDEFFASKYPKRSVFVSNSGLVI